MGKLPIFNKVILNQDDTIDLLLSNGMKATIDSIYYPFVSGYTWYAKKATGSNVIYAMAFDRYWYAKTGKRKSVLLHKIITGTDNTILVDHIDHNGLNNRLTNLRVASNAANQANSRKRLGTTSKYKGVSWKAKERVWVSNIRYQKRQIYIGRFKTQEEAAIAYNNKASELMGYFAHLNIIK